MNKIVYFIFFILLSCNNKVIVEFVPRNIPSIKPFDAKVLHKKSKRRLIKKRSPNYLVKKVLELPQEDIDSLKIILKNIEVYECNDFIGSDIIDSINNCNIRGGGYWFYFKFNNFRFTYNLSNMVYYKNRYYKIPQFEYLLFKHIESDFEKIRIF